MVLQIGSFRNGGGNVKENQLLRIGDYFAIIPSCSHSTMLAKNATTELVCAPLS